MPGPKTGFSIFFVHFIVLFFISGCALQTSDEGVPHSGRKIRVVSTVGMITDVVRNVGGERVLVTGLMGAGTDPHSYRASEGDVRRLSEAELVFFNGLHLEARMGDVLERMGTRIRTVAVAEAIPKEYLLSPPEFQGEYDPHVWFDVTLWMRVTERIRDALAEMDPDHSEVYHANARKYLGELQELHDYVMTRSREISERQRVLITAHDAFNYFGKAYGFEVRGLQGISTEAEAGTADVRALADFITERKIPAIFIESSVPPRSIEAVQEAVRNRGFQVRVGGELFSDAVGTRGTIEETYIGMIRHNINTIVDGLLGREE